MKIAVGFRGERTKTNRPIKRKGRCSRRTAPLKGGVSAMFLFDWDWLDLHHTKPGIYSLIRTLIEYVFHLISLLDMLFVLHSVFLVKLQSLIYGESLSALPLMDYSSVASL